MTAAARPGGAAGPVRALAGGGRREFSTGSGTSLAIRARGLVRL